MANSAILTGPTRPTMPKHDMAQPLVTCLGWRVGMVGRHEHGPIRLKAQLGMAHGFTYPRPTPDTPFLAPLILSLTLLSHSVSPEPSRL